MPKYFLTMQSGDAAAESQSSQEDQWFVHLLGGWFDLSETNEDVRGL